MNPSLNVLCGVIEKVSADVTYSGGECEAKPSLYVG